MAGYRRRRRLQRWVVLLLRRRRRLQRWKRWQGARHIVRRWEEILVIEGDNAGNRSERRQSVYLFCTWHKACVASTCESAPRCSVCHNSAWLTMSTISARTNAMTLRMHAFLERRLRSIFPIVIGVGLVSRHVSAVLDPTAITSIPAISYEILIIGHLGLLEPCQCFGRKKKCVGVRA